MNKHKILISGATGFLGRHVLETTNRLYPHAEILVLVRRPEEWNRQGWVHELQPVEVVCGGVLDVASWQNDERLQGLTTIIHLAAVVRHSRSETDEVYQTNVEGTMNMVRIADQYRCRMIFVSTSGTVGCFDSILESASENDPYCEDMVSTWPYYHSKIIAEKKARTFAEQHAVDLVIVRPPVLLGPGDHRFRATGHVIRLLRGKLPFLLKGGIHFIDIRDAAQAIVRCIALTHAKPVYHLVGKACSVTYFFKMLERVSGVARPKLVLPARLALLLSYITRRIDALKSNHKSTILPDPVVMEMAAKYWGLRSSHAELDLNYKSRDPYETLADTVSWLREHHPDIQNRIAASRTDAEIQIGTKAA